MRWLRGVVGALALLAIAIGAGFFYARGHLAEIALSAARRAAPEWKVGAKEVTLLTPNRLEIRDLSLALAHGKSEVVRCGRAVIDFSLDGLRHHRISAIRVEDPLLVVDEKTVEQLAGQNPPAASSSSAWQCERITVHGGRARIELPHQPSFAFAFASEPAPGETALQRLDLTNIAITGRTDGGEGARGTIRSAAARFALDEIFAGRVRELIVRNPSLHLQRQSGRDAAPSSAPATSNAKNASPHFAIDRLVIDHGDLQISGFGPEIPDTSLKFGLETTNVADTAEQLHHLQLWEIVLSPAGDPTRQFLSLDSIQVDFTLPGLLARKELAGLILTNMTLQVGNDFRSLFVPSPATATATSAETGKPWLIQDLQVHNGRVAIADLGVEMPNIEINLNTQINNVPLSADLRFASDEIQKLELADLTLHSPLDPFAPVVNFKTVFVSFSFAQLMRHEIESLVLLNPTIYVGPDLFWYVDQLKKRQAEAEISTPATAPPIAPEHGWKLKKFEAAYGQLVIANSGQASVPLPLSFSTSADNIRFSSFRDLQLKLNLLVPTADYTLPKYQLEFRKLGGEMKFGLPPEQEANNLVQTLRSAVVRWRQFSGEKVFWSVTFDEKGIYGNCGAAAYGGYLNGQFSFFLKPGSPWEGWVSGSKVDLGQLTDVIAPKNFHMTGPADFKMTVKALSTEIQQVRGTLHTRQQGQLKIGKIDDLLTMIPSNWSSIKEGFTRISLETLRDFEYESGNGDFSFTGKTGTLVLQLHGPRGSRNFNIVVH